MLQHHDFFGLIVLGFLGFRPDLLSSEVPNSSETNPAFCTPRAWSMLSRVLKNQKDVNMISPIIYGTVGYGAAIEFIKDPSLEVQLVAVRRDEWAIRFIENPCLKVCVVVYPELGVVLADPGIGFEENPFRIRCGSRLEELKSKFPLIRQVFIG